MTETCGGEAVIRGLLFAPPPAPAQVEQLQPYCGAHRRTDDPPGRNPGPQPRVTAASPHPGEVVVTSFGYLHAPAPPADIVVDVRHHLRDPHVDPTFRELTGQDAAVWHRVLGTPGATGLVDGLTVAVRALLPAARTAGRLITVAIGCAGGRHRSVVLADSLAERLAMAGVGAEAEHRDIDRPVVRR